MTHYQPKLVDGKKQTKQELLSEIPIEQSKHALASGQLYHVVLENVDPKPQDNFISSNNSITVKEDGKPARWLNSTDWSTLMGSRPADDNTADYHWDDLTRDGSEEKLLSPIMEVGLTTGQSIGMFDMESGSVHPERIYAASQNKPVREHFTPSAQKRVSGFSVASAASTSGALGWSIKQGDRVLASGQIEQPEANFTTHKLTRVVGSFTWYDVALPQDVVLGGGAELRPGIPAGGQQRVAVWRPQQWQQLRREMARRVHGVAGPAPAGWDVDQHESLGPHQTREVVRTGRWCCMWRRNLGAVTL